MTIQMSWAELISCQEVKLACCLLYERYFQFKIVKGVRKISSHAFKMIQDYLSTRYCFTLLTGDIFFIPVTSAEIILYQFQSI